MTPGPDQSEATGPVHQEWIRSTAVRVSIAVGVLFNVGIIAYTMVPLIKSLARL